VSPAVLRGIFSKIKTMQNNQNNKAYKKSNFGGAFFFLPKKKKRALGVIYAFCRYADDIVDEGYQDAQARLVALRQEIEAVFSSKPTTALGQDLVEVLKDFKIPKKYFLDLIDGVETDLRPAVRFETFGDLKWYMYRVASIVGLMCIEIFGYTNEKTKEYAQTLGYAVQMTNIVRDAFEDAKINRIYLSKESLESLGIEEQEVLALKDSPKIEAVLFLALEKSQNYYNKAHKILPKEDFASLLAARAMGNIYEAILQKIQKSPCRFCAKKIKLSKLEKLRILLKTWRERP
jgi:phytoene synthase